MKIHKLLFYILAFSIGTQCSVAASQFKQLTVIKVAILDNFHFQPYITDEFGARYVDGINLANNDLKKMGYEIKYKVFDYDRTHPLAILSAVKKVHAWHPDVVLGPRNSNLFLLIRNEFKHVLVLSTFATSVDIKSLPNNYYSLMLPDEYMARVMYDYVKTQYPNKKVHAIVESDCKNCVDIAKVFADSYNKNNNNLIVKHYLQASLKKSDVKQLMEGYRKGDIVFLPNTAYTTAKLMLNITNYVNQEVVFLGGDGWGAWDNTEVGKLKANQPYYGLHFTPASLEFSHDPMVQRFKKAYARTYKKTRSQYAAFLSFNAVHSIVAALQKYGGKHQEGDIREKILKSYQKALQADSNWFRPKRYVVYRVSHHGQTFLSSVPVSATGTDASDGE